MGHEDGQGVVGLLAHLSVAVLQTGVERGQAQQEVPGPPAQRGQTLRQPAQQLEGRGAGIVKISGMLKKKYTQKSTQDAKLNIQAT